VSVVGNIARQLLKDAYAECEETLLAVMAAGVPLSMIRFEPPRPVFDVTSVHMVARISFVPN
jgi:hypothetical protein